MQMIYNAVSGLSTRSLIGVTFFTAMGFVLMTKLAGRLPEPLYQILLPDYGVALGFGALAVGILAKDGRGLVLAVAGASVAAVSGVVLLCQLSGRWEALLYGLPLALPGAGGVALLAHGVLHARAGLATLGRDVVAIAFVASLGAYVIIRVALWIREGAYDRPGAVFVIGVAAIACLVAAVGWVATDSYLRTRHGPSASKGP